MVYRKPRYTPKSFLKGISRRKSRKGKLKYILVVLVGVVITAVLNGVPIQDQAQQYLAENILSGDVKVIDGDTLHIKGQSFRLLGIDSPERKQTCQNARGAAWACGEVARSTLWKMTNGQQIHCNVTTTDKYNRGVAICYAGNMELNREMVKQGMAVAYTQYSKRYVADEQKAKAAKIGIWQGRFMEPGTWRRQKKL